MTRLTLEKSMRIYDDRGVGDHVEVREDRDGLGLIEIVQDGRIVTVTVEHVPLLASALAEVATHLIDRDKQESTT